MKSGRRFFEDVAAIGLVILAMFVVQGPSRAHAANAGLVAAYSFDETSGTSAADASGNGWNASLFGNATWVPGHTGNALAFDGTSAYGTVASFPALPNWTVTLWVRSPAAPSNAGSSGPVQRQTNFEINWNHQSGSFRGAAAVRVGNTWYTAKFAALSANNWYFLAASYDGQTLRTYTNGALSNSNGAPSGPAASDPNPLTLGKNAAAAQFFTGTVDDVRIYNRALSLAEIQSDMTTPVVTTPPPPPDTTPPTITITSPTSSPTYTATTTPLAVAGTAADNVGVTQVSWANSLGGTGTATGTTNWSATIPLFNGSNVITLTARDAANNTRTATLTVSFSDTAPPSAPTNLTATAVNSSQINLSWTASTDNVAVSTYLVERCQGPSPCASFTQVGTPTATTFSDTGLVPSTTYSYRVRAQDAAGNLGNYSTVASATTSSGSSSGPPGLVAAYAFNENAGTSASDSSGNGWTASLFGGPTWVAGHAANSGNALSFNGTTAYGTVANFPPLPNWSISAWVMSPAAPAAISASGPVHREANFQINWNHATPAFRGAAALNVGGSWYSASFGSLAANTWYYLTATYDGETLSTYTNGALVTTNTAPSGPASSDPNPLTFGKHAASAQFFTGTVDDVRIYNRALSLAEIQSDMTTPVVTTPPPPPDTTPPTITITSPTSSPTYTATTTPLAVAGTAADNVGVTQVSWANSLGGTGTATGTTNWSATIPLFNGSNVITLTARDAANNTRTATLTVSFSDTAPPSAPTNLTATAVSSSQINLSWTASTDNVAVSTYLVERCQGPSPCASFTQVGTPTATTFSDTGLVPSTTYSYRVRAQDAAGNLGNYSTVASATTSSGSSSGPPGLVAAYAFNENAGTSASDSSGNGWTASLFGGPTWVAGHAANSGNALSFNGTTAYGTVANFPPLPNWSISAWVMSPAAPAAISASGPVHREANFQINWNHATPAFRGAAALNVGGSWYSASFGSLAANTWYYLTATYDGETLSTYTNGALVTTNTAPSGPASSDPNPLTFGKHAASAQFFTGTVDDVRIYNRALSLAEIQSDMTTPVVTTPPPPPDTTPPTITITSPTSSPTYTATTTPLAVAGTAADNVGVTQVSWANSLGGTGTATGTTNWSATIPLFNGSNVITLTARDAANNTRTATLTVSFSDTAPPSAPTNLTATAVSSSQINLSWTASTDNVAVSTYLVERCQGPSPCASFTQVGTPTATTFSDTGLVPSTTYSYRVRAQDAAGNLGNYSTVASATTSPGGDPSVVGQWTAAFTTPIKIVHVVSLFTGEVLMWDAFDAGQQAYVWNPTTGNFTYVPSPNNVFCSAQTVLPDGRAVAFGGHAGTSFDGTLDTSLFDPATRSWSNGAPMTYQRWYPTATPLGDGRVLVVSGATTCDTCVADVPEVYDPKTDSWTQLTQARLTMPLYPSTLLLPDGRILYAGSNEAYTPTETLDIGTQTWTAIDSQLIPSAAAIMYRPGLILKSGSPARPNYTPLSNSLATAYVLDMNQAAPAWRQVGSMAFPRTYHTLTVLPDGNVLATSGTQQTDPNTTPVFAAELWNPQTETWITLASAQVARSYHQTALLLADGRVLVAGSGGCCGAPDQYNAEIFSPPYLFKGSRPTIASAPAAIQYGSPFSVGTPNAASIASVVLIRASSVTHTLDLSQHFVPLAFTATQNGLTIQMPANANLAPPGRYLLFIVNSQGIPSVASLLSLAVPAQDLQPPSAPTGVATAILPGAIQLTWQASTDNVSVSHYNVYRSKTSGFSPGPATLVAQPVYAAFSDPGLASGTYYYVVAALDLAGNTSSFSSQVSATITGGGGLVASYAFDESSGASAADSSGNGHTIALIASPQWVPGHDGNALSFDGVASYGVVSAFPALSTWTVSAWVKSPAAPANAPPAGPVHRETNYQLNWNHLSPDVRGAAVLNVNNAWYAASFGTLNANTWYYLTATYDGETLNAYTNGVLVTSNPLPSGPAASDPNPLTFGKHAALSQFFQGIIDNVRIYNRALSQNEIVSDMNTPVTTTP